MNGVILAVVRQERYSALQLRRLRCCGAQQCSVECVEAPQHRPPTRLGGSGTAGVHRVV